MNNMLIIYHRDKNGLIKSKLKHTAYSLNSFWFKIHNNILSIYHYKTKNNKNKNIVFKKDIKDIEHMQVTRVSSTDMSIFDKHLNT